MHFGLQIANPQIKNPQITKRLDPQYANTQSATFDEGPQMDFSQALAKKFQIQYPPPKNNLRNILIMAGRSHC